MQKESKHFIRFGVVALIVGTAIIVIAAILVSISSVRYRHENVYIDYIIADDYSYAIDAYNKDKTFSPIEKLPDTIHKENSVLPVSGRLEKNKSKSATCYEYEYEGLTYLEVEIYDNKFIIDEGNTVFLYYVEDT